MFTLVLDSSASDLSVGFLKDGKLVCFTSYEAWQAQSEHMIPEISALMEKYEISYEMIDGIICGIGPGSYTGVRIAITVAKTASLALNVPVYPVSSLRILKDFDNPSICLINARSNRSYFGVFEKNKIIINDCIKTNDEVKEYIASHPNYSVCGDTKYLGIEGIKSNVCEQMGCLLSSLEKMEDTLGLKPVYMKD